MDEITFPRSLLIGFALTCIAVVAFVGILVTNPFAPPPPPSPTPTASPWVRPLTTMPGLEDQVDENPAVLNCWLSSSDEYRVLETQEFPIGTYVKIRAIVDGKPCYGWMKPLR